jgi:transposase-like protein
MTTPNKNKYSKGTHISERKFRQLIKCFSLDLNAFETSKIINISYTTCKKIFQKLRIYIYKNLLENNIEDGEFELDESYFGAKRVRGKRGRGAAGKTPVFGLLKRDGNVYVQIVKNCSRAELMPIIEGKILEGSTIHTDGWKAYDGLVLNGYDHYRVFHSKDEFVRGKSHVNGIESFWSFTKRRLAKFNGLRDEMFYLHLKESEFRFNNRHNDIYVILLKNLRQNNL